MFYIMPMVVICSLVVLEVSGVLHHTRGMEFKASLKRKGFSLKDNLLPDGLCWKSVLGRVDEECRNLSEEKQSKMALDLSNCFLKMSGHQVHGCESYQEMSARGLCIGNMSDRAFNVFTSFYKQVDSMCWRLMNGANFGDLSEKSAEKLEAAAIAVDLTEEIGIVVMAGLEIGEKIIEKMEKRDGGKTCNMHVVVKSSNEIIQTVVELIRKYYGYLAELQNTAQKN